MSEALHRHREGAVLTLVLDHPGRRNALSLPLRGMLHDALEEAAGDPAIRCLVLAGAGGTFCSGGDIAGMQVPDLGAAQERMRRSHRLVRLLVAGRLPVVAAVEGWAAGAGLSLAAACDTVVAAADARFVAGFGGVGLMADFGLPFTLPQRVGAGRARQILLHGAPLEAAEAERIGLVDRVVPQGGALAAAQALAAGLAAQAPLAVAATRRILAEGLERALEAEAQAQAMLFLSADHAEGRAAFLARRKPDFRGA